ncbi:hypothetical protein ABZS93_09955 [Streptomyces sp900116325]|uniref:hypothetical protein n=1 Tax=Streptomyces sp. 900116325 TaxID=3154295 RepID=UPI0033ABCD81
MQPVVDYVQRAAEGGRQIAVLIPEWSRSTVVTRSCRISGGLPPAAALRARTDVVVCVVPYRLSL